MASGPTTFNARAVAIAALNDLGIGNPGEAVSPGEMQDALLRLNRLVSALRLQEFSVPFVARKVFPITANQNTYTIGPGGELETQRPQQIRAAGLLLTPSTGTFTITGVSVTNRTFTVAGDQTGSFPSGSDFVVSGSTGNDGNYTIVTATFSVTTTVRVSEVVPSAVVDGTIQVLGDANATTEIPIGLLTDDAYQSIQVKGMGNTQWTQLYYNPTYAGGLGLIWLWPKPTTNANALVLYLDQFVDGFENLTTEYDFPPGYFDLFESGLALRMAPPYGISNGPTLADIRQQFAAAQALVKRSNVKRADMPLDPAITIGAQGFVWNILTGTNN